jgi:MFS superfamily sulfate permease-like transporter
MIRRITAFRSDESTPASDLASETLVMLATVVVTVATHNLASGVIVGVLTASSTTSMIRATW